MEKRTLHHVSRYIFDHKSTGCTHIFVLLRWIDFYILKQRFWMSRLYFNRADTNIKFQVTYNILDKLWNPHVSLRSKIGYEVTG